MSQIALLGGGGHASDVLGLFEDVARIENQSRPPICILSDSWDKRERFENRNVELVTDIKSNLTAGDYFIACVGYPGPRSGLADLAVERGLTPYEPVIHPLSNINQLSIGNGSLVLSGCSISPLVTIGEHCYVSHGALIGHDTVISDYCTLMPGCSVSGDVVLEEKVLVGASATILEKVRVGAGAQIGAGALVTKDVEPGTTVVGVPAKPFG